MQSRLNLLLTPLFGWGLLIAGAPVMADQVRTTTGSVTGQVTAMSPVSVTVTRGSTEKKVSVGGVRSIRFEDEPSQLRQARINYRNGAYKRAIEQLREINAGDVPNPYIREDIAFYTVASRASLALLGEGSFTDAGRALDAFLKQDPKGYHWLDGVVLMGDLLVAAKRYEGAEARYGQLAKAPWPAAKVRAQVLLGGVSQAKGEHGEAIRRFEAALAAADGADANDNDSIQAQRLSARLGKAVSLAATGKLDQGVELVEGVIADSDPGKRRLNATAYNALGNCYREAGQAKEAAFAYLHVDLLYASVPEQHAEALYHLGGVLEEIGKPRQAREARTKLKERYASSEWAKK